MMDLAELLNRARPSWMRHGACQHSDVDFFPPRGGDTAAAKAMCARCPVRTACAEYGLGQRHGIWGGLTEQDRRRLRRQRRTTGAVVPGHPEAV